MPSDDELAADLAAIMSLYLLLRARGGVLPLEDVEDRFDPLKRPAEVRQHPHRNEVDADEGLDAGNDPHPTPGAKAVFARLHPGNPTADVEIAPPEVKS